MKKFITFILIACCLLSMTACSKDEMVEQYNTVLQAVGDKALTADSDLQGERTLGSDSYVGKYAADYSDYTGKETIFGGTALERDTGNKVSITCKLNIQAGTIKLILQSGTEQPKVLTEESGDYSETIELPSASNYILVEGDGFTGSIELEIE